MFRRILYTFESLWPRRSREVRRKKKKRKKENVKNEQVIGFFPVKWRTLGPIPRRMQLDGSIRETRISRFEENSCSMYHWIEFDCSPSSSPVNRYSEKFQARFLSDAHGNEKSNKTRNLPESLKLLPSFLPCSRVVWWGLKLTIPGSTLPSFFQSFNLNL